MTIPLQAIHDIYLNPEPSQLRSPKTLSHLKIYRCYIWFSFLRARNYDGPYQSDCKMSLVDANDFVDVPNFEK